jgi:arylsulfatase
MQWMAGAARALGAVLVVLSAACDGGRSRDGGPALPFDRFVLVTVDTLRADHLGTYGYPVETSPFLDALAERSVVFERAYAAIATTAPSHATMFTSLYPIQHRVLKNGLVLGGGYLTLAELLEEAGFATGGFASTRSHFGVGGLDRGFETFEEPRRQEREGLPYRDARATTDAALRWLEDFDARDRFFLWIHLFDVHQPHRPPEPHLRAVSPQGAAERQSLARFLHEEHQIPGGDPQGGAGVFRRGDEGMLKFHTGYDGEIHFVDAELRRLFDAFRRLGLASRALWIITSDHGEGLGNHDYKHHGKHIYEEQVRIPLLFFSEEPWIVPRRVDALVEHVDLLPTVASLVGRGDALAAQEPPFQGRSLVPLLTGEPSSAFPERLVFVQRRSYEEADRRSPLVALDFERDSKFAVVERRWKYIHRTVGSDELYDLRADPYETRNLVGRHPELAERMKAALLARARRLSEKAGPDAESVDAETIEQLRALGYAP